ncbi:O-antigen ligase family protein [Hydrogenophaga sp.]|uniref:O-antigen ligase family protein n=1 Tax=Hydrogenophaga sp. TaxID=1904254 RepID=UPI002619235B|nr:O-antigen ligase family protein [Hydrogenophaga sp.]MCW5653766.1 O-antigen ligase family protein [Hydrogenophaga sp.]
MLDRFQSTMDQTARWAAVTLMLGVPTSIALVNISLLLILVGWFLSGRFAEKWALIRHHPITWPSLLLFGLVLVGIAYTDAPRSTIGSHLYVYSKFPMMLMLLTLLHEPRWQQRALLAYVAGALITLVSTYANVWVEVPWSDTHVRGFGVSHNVFNDYIAQGLAMSVFTAIAVVFALEARTLLGRLGWGLVVALTVFSITHLLEGRTGQAVLLVMFSALALVSVPVAWRWRALAGVVLVMVVLFASSPLLRERVLSGIHEFTQYMQGGVVATSIGARLDMWKNALDMFLSSPVWGHGTGGYRVLSLQIYNDAVQCAVSCVHPHNQFLFFAAEHGIVGVLAYAWLLWAAFRAGLSLEGRYRLLAVAFMAILFVDSFINGPFWVTTERHLFASVMPLLLAGWRPRPSAPEARS